MEPGPDLPPKKKRRWGWWTVLVLNLLGALLILPLLKVTVPLAKVWWDTRSQESLRSHGLNRAARGDSPEPATAALSNSSVSAPDTSLQGINGGLEALTNQLGLVEKLSDTDLGQIAARSFGARAKPQLLQPSSIWPPPLLTALPGQT